MDLSTTYLGFRLPHPLMPGASPLVDDLDVVRRLEDAGAAAIVLHSLFEEQITRDALGTLHQMDVHADSSPEALSYFPRPDEFVLGPERYLEQVRLIKEAVRVPVIASLNGTTDAGWIWYARLLQQAGADALELNVYNLTTSLWTPGETIETKLFEIVRKTKQTIQIPVAVKLSPFFTSFAHVARQLDEAGADALILFNRFYQPDLDPESLDVVPSLRLSDSSELLLRLRWLAILSRRVKASLAVTGGVHTPLDAVKAVMAGADAVQVVSALLEHGPEHLAVIRKGMEAWLEEHEYVSLAQLRGSLDLASCPDPGAFERANYMRVLQSWEPRRHETADEVAETAR